MVPRVGDGDPSFPVHPDGGDEVVQTKFLLSMLFRSGSFRN